MIEQSQNGVTDVQLEIRQELENLATTFEADQFSATGRAIRNLANLVPSSLNPLESAYLTVRDAFKGEFATDAYREALFDSVAGMFTWDILKVGKLEDKLLELRPLIDNMCETATNIATISRLFKGVVDVKEQYVGSCLAYLLQVGGEFSDAIRFLYTIKCAEQNIDATLEAVSTMSLWDIRARFREFEVTDALFKGWEDDHLRNAIAHARFAYDDDTQTMTFEDVDPCDGRTVYNNVLTLPEFSEFASAIANVNILFQRFIMLLRVGCLLANLVSPQTEE
jgi:hypothetical protein